MRLKRAVLLLAVATPALAHEGHPHATATRLPSADAWNAVIALSLTLLVTLYLVGLFRLWRSGGGRKTIGRWQAAAFVAGCASSALALLSPLDRWSDVLFSAHMAQHEILMLVGAPLMVLGRPFIAILWAFGPRRRLAAGALLRRPLPVLLWARLSGPFTVLILHAVVLWGWHLPWLFEAALHDETIHAIQHLGFFLTAALFWWALIHGRYGRLGYGVGVLYVFATAMHTEILGALLTFDSRSLYPTHAERTAAAGISPLADQQLAGILMWVPFGAVFVVIGLALFAAWLGESERRALFAADNRELDPSR